MVSQSNVDFFNLFDAFHIELKTGGGIAAHQIADHSVGFQLVIDFNF